MAKRKKNEEIKIEFNRREELNLKEFLLLDNKKQDAKIKEILNTMYDGKIEVSKKHIDKVLNICFDTRDNEVYLPASLKVEKIGSKLIFTFKKVNNLVLFILFALAFLLIGGFATYMGIHYLARLELNQDLDGDGIADLNIDLDDDGICDINCDTNKDKKPDRNIDYRSNRKPIFNTLLEDGTIFNPINQDINGDGVCDINCDEDKDNVCDSNCTNVNIGDNGGGTSQDGNGDIEFSTASLIVIFDSTDGVSADDIYPDDQVGEGVNTEVPSIGFTVQNTTNKVLYYDLSWTIIENTFTSDNFWYKISSDNDGFNQDWETAPKSDYKFATRVAIAPNTTQTYVVEFTLHGTGEEQNYDQGKRFNGQIHVDLIEE